MTGRELYLVTGAVISTFGNLFFLWMWWLDRREKGRRDGER